MIKRQVYGQAGWLSSATVSCSANRMSSPKVRQSLKLTDPRKKVLYPYLATLSLLNSGGLVWCKNYNRAIHGKLDHIGW
jgi:hypothetical protein